MSTHGSDRDAEETHVPQAGDWIEVAGTGESSPRRGVILEVLGEGSHTHFRVRWDEEHESLYFPDERHFIVHPANTRRST